MGISIYAQEAPIELMYPMPFMQILNLARKRHSAYWRTIQAEIEKVAIENKEAVVSFLSDSIIKAMEEEVTLGEVSSDTMKELKTNINYLNNQFKNLNDYFESLDVKDKKELILPFIEREITDLRNYRDKFVEMVNSKPRWDDNDAIICTYYSLYQENITVYRNKLKKVHRWRIGSIIDIIKILTLVYKSVLLTYIIGKPVKNEIILKRLGELRANIIQSSHYIRPISYYILPTNRRKIADALSTVAPIS